MLREHRVKLTCPNCKANIGSALETCAEHEPPIEPGGYCVCAECAALLAFTDDLQLRFVEPEELWGEPPDLLVQILQIKLAVFRRHMQGRPH